MASENILPLLLFFTTTTSLFNLSFSSQAPQPADVFSFNMLPFNCSNQIKTCNSILYQHNRLSEQQITRFYSVNASQISPITHFSNQDHLITVPCSCQNVGGTVGYFYDTVYTVQPGDTFASVSSQIYSGQLWNVGGEEGKFIAGQNVTMNLVCGCLANDDAQIVVTYTVQERDTLFGIANLLSSQISEINKLNRKMLGGSGLIVVGWVLYVPMEKSKIPGI